MYFAQSIRRFIKTAPILVLLFNANSHAATQTQMRGERYCEVLIGKSLTMLSVYNTWGLNTCPENLWQQLSTAEIKKETAAKWVHLNGPRYWTIDGFESTTLVNPTVHSFHGLTMREAGILHIKWLDFFGFAKAYHPKTVERHTTWIYEAGKPVYELIDPQHHVYVMQSFSIQKKAQTLASLNQLASALHLPSDWQFKTGILTKKALVPAVNNEATVIQDEFLNTYQLAPDDLL